jgi:hypothetical protein
MRYLTPLLLLTMAFAWLLQPSTLAKPRRWVLSGESNAMGLKPALESYAPIVGVQRNSTPIAAWAPSGALWATLAATLPHSTAFIWWQGESDVRPGGAMAENYPAALEDLMAQVTAITGPIRIVICSANSNDEYRALRALQRAEAHAHRWVYVPSNDLPQPGPGDLDVPSQMILPATFRIGASPHLSQGGYQQMAARLAAVLH